MAKVDLASLRQLMDEVENLRRLTASRDSHIQTTQRSAIGDAVETSEAYAVDRWSELSADHQKQLLKRLTLLRNELLARTKQDAPQLGNSIEDAGMSRMAIIWFAIFGFLFAATLLSLIG